MSYQVLARKWRPQNFKEMVGQEHVLKALINALEKQRLHHAYLFTGTRGVGKTTIGRILAKCLNCENGITAEPCGQCSACMEIAEGRFVDLIEIDAASRTKVEDMRELLDNVQYAPTRGRFKVYLIDEVHMLSQSSFNALLKTLEEPPEHVKFLLATTDPQKLPVTILSRCLQFNLKNMPAEQIVAHLTHVLKEEDVSFTEQALWLLARAASGSMRDALSLTDQAIGYGNHKLVEDEVSAMLGTVDQQQVFHLLNAIAEKNAQHLLDNVAAMAEYSPDYAEVLASLSSVLHRITIEQVLPNVTDNAMGDKEQIIALARALTPEDVQLYYQIALMGRKDLDITPDPRVGLEMTLLRMLAFTPNIEQAIGLIQTDDAPAASVSASPSQVEPAVSAPKPTIESNKTTIESNKPAENEPKPSVASLESSIEYPSSEDNNPPIESYEADLQQLTPPWDEQPISTPSALATAYPENVDYSGQSGETVKKSELTVSPENVQDDASLPESQPPEKDAIPDENNTITGDDTSSEVVSDKDAGAIEEGRALSDADETNIGGIESTDDTKLSETIAVNNVSDRWVKEVHELGINGLTHNIACHSVLKLEGETLVLAFEPEFFRLFNETKAHEQRLREALTNKYGERPIRFELGVGDGETPEQYFLRHQEELQANAERSIASDVVFNALLSHFNGRLIEDSIRPRQDSVS